MIEPDRLRPPSLFDPHAGWYKDWLHVNVVDKRTGVIGLVNASLHGAPTDPRMLAVGAAVFHHPEQGWLGNVYVNSSNRVRVTPYEISSTEVALAIEPKTGRLLGSVRAHDAGVTMDLQTDAPSGAVRFEHPFPFGAGWIAWRAAPRLLARGELRVGEVKVPLEGTAVYHDHNWGRWRWGDDVGWDWGVFCSSEDDATFVFSRATDGLHTRASPALLIAEGVRGTPSRRRYSGLCVTRRPRGTYRGALRRLPGALAALRSDRRSTRLPAAVQIAAADGFDRIQIEFETRAALQLIAAEPTRAGYSFIHELVGPFSYEAVVEGHCSSGTGLAIMEHTGA